MSRLDRPDREPDPPDYASILCRFVDLSSLSCTVVHLPPHPMPGTRAITRALETQTSADIVIVVIDAGRLSAVGKLLALLSRNRTVRAIGQALENRGLRAFGSYALYPSARRVSVAYERGTAAGRYAESMLLTTPRSGVARRLDRMLSRTSLGPASVELVAVVGRRG